MWAGKSRRRAVAQKHVTRREFIAASALPASWEGGGGQAALMAGASLIALAALGAPAASACSGHNQTISNLVTGPIFSTGGQITVLASGTVTGDPDGVDVIDCSATTLTNQGEIPGQNGVYGFGGTKAGVGVGIAPGRTLTSLFNAAGAKILGGNGIYAGPPRATPGCRTPARSRR